MEGKRERERGEREGERRERGREERGGERGEREREGNDRYNLQ